MAAFGAALGDQQVPVVADPVQVRRLRGLGAGRPGPDVPEGPERPPGVRVEPDLPHAGDSAPAGAVVVPGEVGIDAGDAGQRDRVGPGARRVGGGDQQVAAAADVGDDQPEAAVVVAQGRRVDAAGGGRVRRQPQLAGPVEDVADLGPVHQVPAVQEGHAGEVLEAGTGEVVVLAHPADARIGEEAGDHGIGDGGARRGPARHPDRVLSLVGTCPVRYQGPWAAGGLARSRRRVSSPGAVPGRGPAPGPGRGTGSPHRVAAPDRGTGSQHRVTAPVS